MLRTLTLLFGIAASGFAAVFSGVVVADHDGSPVPGAAVTIKQATGAVAAELETDDAGRFRAPNLVAGQYVASLAKANFETLERRVNIGAADSNQTLRMIRFGVITGEVLDTQGQGVRNAVVAAIPVSPNGGLAPPNAGSVLPGRGRPTGVTTDARGRYRLHGLTPGSYVIAMAVGDPRNAVAPVSGVLPDTSLGNDVQLYPSNARPQVFTVQGGEEQKINFTAYKGNLFSVSGTVSGPASNSAYLVVLQRGDLPTVRIATARTSPTGEFQFTRLVPGSYRLTVSATAAPEPVIVDGQIVDIRAGKIGEPAFGEARAAIGGQDVTGVLVSVSRGVAPKLVYQPAAGCPQQATVRLVPLEDWGNGTTTLAMKAGEAASFPVLPPTPYVVDLSSSGPTRCFAQAAQFDMRQASSDVAIPVIAIPYGAIKGKFDTAGKRTEDYEVVLMPPDGAATKRFPLDAESRFTIPDLQPGKYRVGVRPLADRSALTGIQEIDVGSGSSIEIEFAALP